MVNGLPVNAAYTPFNCQSAARAFAKLPYPLSEFRHGSAYTNPSWKLCLRSKPAGAQFRESWLGVLKVSVALPSASLSFIALLRVYAPLNMSPFVKGLFSATCSELYWVFRRWPQESSLMMRPSEKYGRPALPVPMTVGALMSRAAYPPVPLAPTYATSTDASSGRRRWNATFQVWTYPRSMLSISGVYSAAALSSGFAPLPATMTSSVVRSSRSRPRPSARCMIG